MLPAADVLTHATHLATRIAEKPRAALAVLKRTLSLPRRQAFEQSITTESLMHELTLRGAAATALAGDGHVE